jgi:putative intracellular protease/amidase
MLSNIPRDVEAEMETKTETVHLFVMDGLADWEPGLAVAGINTPAYQARPGRYTVRTVGLTRDPVRTMGGISILPDLTLDALSPERSAMLILPGGPSWDEGENTAAAEKAAEFLAAGVPVAAICGATAGLAARGLLDGRAHTSNAAEYLEALPGYGGREAYVDVPAVRDGDLVTATGTSPVDFARAIFERLELYAPEVLDAWYALYRHGDPSGFYALQAAAPSDPGAGAAV